MADVDPAVRQWQAALGLGESTSARLRRVEAERDEARADSLCVEAGKCGWRPLAVQLMREQQEATADRSRLVALIEAMIRGRNQLRQERDRAYAGRIYVARGPSGTCVLCGSPIVRGQAVEAVAGTTTKPAWTHCACPEKES